MIGNWTHWKRFPNAEAAEFIDAPAGPGIYEVRYILNGDLAAFDASADVAHALSTLRPAGRSWKRFFRHSNEARQRDLEYRTCTAASMGEAKVLAELMRSRRQTYWRRAYIQPRASSAA